jgi:hypothetical protein
MTPKRLEKHKVTTTTTITKSNKKKIKVNPKAEDSVSIYMTEQKQLVQAKINKINVSLPADHAHERKRLLKMCEELVKEHPTWSKTKFLKYFPEYGPIIGLVIEDESDDD